MSEDYLRAQAALAGQALQAIQDLAKRGDVPAAKVRFPRGYLVTVDDWHARLPWMQSYVARKNIAYTLMLLDAQRWLLQRTDLSGHAADMVVKACLVSLGAIGESLLVDATSPPLGKRQKMPSRIKHLLDKQLLSDALAVDLAWLWEMRNRQHLQGLASRDFSVYQPRDLERGESAIWALCDTLKEARKAGAA